MAKTSKKTAAKCEICGVANPIDRAHLIPKRFLKGIKGLEYLYDFDGENTVKLCRNHHTLFDRFQLEEVDFLKIWPKLDKMLAVFANEIVPKIVCMTVDKNTGEMKMHTNRTEQRRVEMLGHLKKINTQLSF